MKRSFTVYNEDNRGIWGRITITAAEEAGRVLTYSAFKVWLRFMLDRDYTECGKRFRREISSNALKELGAQHYLRKSDDQSYWVFNVMGKQ